MKVLLEIFGDNIVLLATTIIVVIFKLLADEVRKIQNDKLQKILLENENVINKVYDVTVNTVGKYTQEVVDELKKNDKWNKQEAEKVFRNAYNEIQGQLGADTIDVLNEIRGNADIYLKNVMENAIREQK